MKQTITLILIIFSITFVTAQKPKYRTGKFFEFSPITQLVTSDFGTSLLNQLKFNFGHNKLGTGIILTNQAGVGYSLSYDRIIASNEHFDSYLYLMGSYRYTKDELFRYSEDYRYDIYQYHMGYGHTYFPLKSLFIQASVGIGIQIAEKIYQFHNPYNGISLRFGLGFGYKFPDFNNK